MTKFFKFFFAFSIIFMFPLMLPAEAQESISDELILELEEEIVDSGVLPQDDLEDLVQVDEETTAEPEQSIEDAIEPVAEITNAEEILGLENENDEVFEDVSYQDEEIVAEDLGIIEPKVLPTDRVYIFKELWRGMRLAFTFNKVKKVEKRLKFANERLIEAQSLADKTGNAKVLDSVLEKYQKDMERIARRVEKFKDKDQAKLERFTEVLADRQIKHQRILQKLKENIPTNVFKKVKEAQDNSLNSFSRVLNKIKNKEKMAENLESVLDNVRGREFKQFKNLEFLNQLSNVSAEEVKNSLVKVQKRQSEKFYNNLNKMPKEDRVNKFGKYLKGINGNKAVQSRILEDLKSDFPEKFPQILDNVKEKRRSRLNNQNLKEIKKKEDIPVSTSSKEPVRNKIQKREVPVRDPMFDLDPAMGPGGMPGRMDR